MLHKLSIIGKEKTQVAEAKGVGQTFSKVTNFYFKGLILTKSKIKRKQQRYANIKTKGRTNGYTWICICSYGFFLFFFIAKPAQFFFFLNIKWL